MSIILQIWDNFHVISLQVLTSRKQNTRGVYQDSWPPTAQPPHSNFQTQKVTANLNLTCKNIYFKTKNKSNTSGCYRKKSNFVSKKTGKQVHVPSDYNL